MNIAEAITERILTRDRIQRMFLTVFADRPPMLAIKEAQDKVLDALYMKRDAKLRHYFNEILKDVGYIRVIIDGKRWYKEKTNTQYRRGKRGKTR